jgi:dCMP deaminase
MNRLSWDAYFLQMAKLVGSRAACYRAQVGAVLVRDKRIVSTGYNGAPRGRKNCFEIGYCYRDKNKIPSGTNLEKCRAVGTHAEVNSIYHAALFGVSVEGTIMFLAGHDFLCSACKAAILNAKIGRVVLWTREGQVFQFNPEECWNEHEVDLVEGKVEGERLIEIENEIDDEIMMKEFIVRTKDGVFV